jgi:CBS domain-containing membrane protein
MEQHLKLHIKCQLSEYSVFSMALLTLRKWLGIELIEIGWAERVVSAMGSGLAIAVLIGIIHWQIPGGEGWAVAASMGASAVLLFAVPHSALAQPWPVLAGHTVAAVIGVACARWCPERMSAAGFAVGLTVAVMQVLKCVHPPGGGTALAAVMGGETIRSLGFGYVLLPVLANAAVMVALAFVYNFAFRWRRYPVILSRPPIVADESKEVAAEQPTHEEVAAAIRSLDSFVDISEEDLLRLVEVLSQARGRRTR